MHVIAYKCFSYIMIYVILYRLGSLLIWARVSRPQRKLRRPPARWRWRWRSSRLRGSCNGKARTPASSPMAASWQASFQGVAFHVRHQAKRLIRRRRVARTGGGAGQQQPAELCDVFRRHKGRFQGALRSMRGMWLCARCVRSVCHQEFVKSR